MLQRELRSEFVNLDAMVDDEVTRNQWIDLLRITAHSHHRASQSGEVDDGWNTGEVLQDNSTGLERHFNFGWLRRVPVGKIIYVVCGDDEVVHITQARFKEHSD